ncbi:MAG: ATP-binding cassette domain-containing protein [Eggerthellaceae bacterium]|nr:ATP-binding cassette domain-containing protein [Eggerthellaceae bacterium]
MLSLRDISFRYGKTGPLVFDGFSLDVHPGDRLHLDAPSGFGKTTLCKIMAGYEVPISGSVTVDGKPLPRKGKCPVQLIGQHPERMLDPRCRMQVSLTEAGEIDEALLCRLGIQSAWLTRFPHELSGGELQRICIARALMANPAYLIADEISTMLDAVTQAQIWDVILTEADARGLGLVLTTHSPSLASHLARTSLSLASS